MGRRSIGARPMTTAQRVRKHRRKKRLEEERARRAERIGKLVEAAPLNSLGDFNVVLADVPWRTAHSEFATGISYPEHHYPTMSVDAIKQLTIPAASDCILYLWTTIPHLANAIDVMRCWGFDYRSHRVWVKDRIGTGLRVREMHEVILIGVRGMIPTALSTERVPSIFTAPRGKRHSEKPVEVHQWIEKEYPALKKLELFARAQRPGWTCWGNEVALLAAG